MRKAFWIAFLVLFLPVFCSVGVVPPMQGIHQAEAQTPTTSVLPLPKRTGLFGLSPTETIYISVAILIMAIIGIVALTRPSPRDPRDDEEWVDVGRADTTPPGPSKQSDLSVNTKKWPRGFYD